jgi:hypothetical protein
MFLFGMLIVTTSGCCKIYYKNINMEKIYINKIRNLQMDYDFLITTLYKTQRLLEDKGLSDIELLELNNKREAEYQKSVNRVNMGMQAYSN